MDQGWMYFSKPPDPKFVDGVDSFVKIARAYCINKLQADDHVYYPCVDCCNQKQFRNIEQIHCHLLISGFMANYKIWNKHGETGENLHQEASQQDPVQEIVHENIVERVDEIVEETISKVGNDTLYEEDVPYDAIVDPRAKTTWK
jgi:hypothetical protein